MREVGKRLSMAQQAVQKNTLYVGGLAEEDEEESCLETGFLEFLTTKGKML